MSEEIEFTDKEKEIIYKPEKLRLLCRNCNKEWIDERPTGYHIRSEPGNNYLVSREASDKTRKYFTCPECNSKDKIARLPL